MGKYQVRVKAATGKIVPLVKSFRLVADLGLRDAKDLADYVRETVPCVLVAGIDREVAEHVVDLLEGAGLSAIAEESSLTVPMLLCPSANQKYVWHWLAGPTPES